VNGTVVVAVPMDDYTGITLRNLVNMIQQILGHENIQTMNLYTITTEQDKVDALEALEW